MLNGEKWGQAVVPYRLRQRWLSTRADVLGTGTNAMVDCLRSNRQWTGGFAAADIAWPRMLRDNLRYCWMNEDYDLRRKLDGMAARRKVI